MPCQRPYLGEILVAEVSVGLYLEDLAQEKLVIPIRFDYTMKRS